MSDARDAILGRLRAHLGDPEIRRDAVDRRLAAPPRGPAPAVAADLVAAFCTRVVASAATVETVNAPHALPEAVLRYCAGRGLPPRLWLAPEPWLQTLPWPPVARIDTQRVTDARAVGLARAFAGVAETGSLVLLSGPGAPTALNFLPEHYLCVLDMRHIVPTLDDLWARMRGEGLDMPRALNLITGPSRTGDVEQTIELGAHGPRSVHVLLVQETA